ANSRNEQENEPGAAADESRSVACKKPGQPGDYQHNSRRHAPTAISFTRSPRSRQNEQWRNHSDEKKNAIQIHRRKPSLDRTAGMCCENAQDAHGRSNLLGMSSKEFRIRYVATDLVRSLWRVEDKDLHGVLMSCL